MFRVRQPPLRGNLMLSDRMRCVYTRSATVLVFRDFYRRFTKKYTVVAAEDLPLLLHTAVLVRPFSCHLFPLGSIGGQ